MPRVQENAPGIRPSRSISRGSRISTITTSSLCAALMASAALNVSICALASSISDLMPRWMVWGMASYLSIPSFRDGPEDQTRNDDKYLPHQFLHRAIETFDRDREHALRKQPANDGGRFRIIPVPLRHRIEPHRVRVGARDAFEPDRSGLFIDMLDRAAGDHDFVRAHRGVADEHHLVVVRIFMQHVPGRGAVGKAPAVLLPDTFIEAIVEVEIFHVLEFGLRRGEQFLDLLDVRIHRAADIEEHQHLDRVAPFGAHMHVEITVVGGLLDRGVEVEFVGGAGAGEFAKPPQRDLDVADAEFDVAVEILEFAAVPHLHGAEIAVLLLPDADAFGIVALRAERRSAGGADPFVAALMPALLLLQALAQRLHELVPAQRLDLFLLFTREVFRRELLQAFGC